MTEYTLDFSIAGEYEAGGTEIGYWQFIALMAGADYVEVGDRKITRDDAPFIIQPPAPVVVERGGPGSGHFGHSGRPGKVGGSLPSGVGSIDVPKFTDKQQEWVDWALGGMDDPEVYENPFPTIEEAMNDPNIRRGLLWRLEELAPDLAGGAGYDQEGTAALSSARAAKNAAKKIRKAVEDYRRGLLDLSAEDVLSIVGDEEERFWGFVEAVMSNHYSEYGPNQEATWKEARSDWIENWQYEKHGMSMDEGQEWLDSLDKRERYQVYDDLIQMHFQIYEGQDKEEIIPQVSRRFPKEFMEVLARHLDVIERGGPGSGHFDHEGRPGKVGGSLPSGKGKGRRGLPKRQTSDREIAEVKDETEGSEPDRPGKIPDTVEGVVGKTSIPTHYKNPEYGERLNKQIEYVEQSLGVLPQNVILISDNPYDAAKYVLEREQELEGEKWSAAKYLKLEARLKHNMKRIIGGMIPVRGSDEVVLYSDPEKSTGEYDYGDQVVAALEGEPEYVITHELAHAFMNERDEHGSLRLENKVALAHFDLMEKTAAPERMQEIAVPRPYLNKMAELYRQDVSMNKVESEFYADIISYGIRLEQNPDENRIMLRGDYTMTLDDWYEGYEKPDELAPVLLDAIRDYYKEQEEEPLAERAKPTEDEGYTLIPFSEKNGEVLMEMVVEAGEEKE